MLMTTATLKLKNSIEVGSADDLSDAFDASHARVELRTGHIGDPCCYRSRRRVVAESPQEADPGLTEALPQESAEGESCEKLKYH